MPNGIKTQDLQIRSGPSNQLCYAVSQHFWERNYKITLDFSTSHYGSVPYHLKTCIALIALTTLTSFMYRVLSIFTGMIKFN